MTRRLVQRAALLSAVCIVCGVAARAQAQTPQASAPIVRTTMDRTAMWIADRVTYSVDIVCPKGIDILPDDLAKEKLKTTGLDVLATQTTVTTAADDSTTQHVDYVLTTYHADTPTLEIAPLTVRYFVRRPGQRLQDEAPAGELQVPGGAVAFRSTLPNDPERIALRDGRSFALRGRLFTSARAVGLALMLVSFAPLAFVAASTARRWRPRTAGKSARRVRQEERLTYETLQAADVSTVDARRRAFDGIDTLVRAHLRDVVGIPGPSLTPAEVVTATGDRRIRVPAETIAALLAACEHARYGPPEAVPPADECREAIAQAGQLLGAR